MSSSLDLNAWLNLIAQRHTPDIILGLERIKIIAIQLQLIHFNCPVITVAGTNGKGSTVATLQRLYSSAGYKTGCYYSPHLHHFTERVQINNQPIDEVELCKAFEKLTKEISNAPLTFFEFITLAALSIFKEKELDIIILEVGLGGRLDAVNCVESTLAILTQIDFDHCDRLGNNREAIGFEKAGIFRENKIVICGDSSPPNSVIKRAQELHCDFYTLGKDFFIRDKDLLWDWEMPGKSLHNLSKPLLPQNSVACALVAAQLLQNQLTVSQDAMSSAATQTSLPGRYEVIQDRCTIIFDVAHNQSSAALLAQKLTNQPHTGKTIAVFSVLADKDCKGMIEPFSELVHEWHVFPLDTPRACQPKEIIQQLQTGEGACHLHPNVTKMWEELKGRLSPEDRVVVYGSFYTVAAVQQAMSLNRN